MKKSSIARHVPDTRILTPGTLQSMLKQYKMIYIKPNRGMFGDGVIRIEHHLDRAEYSYHAGTTVRTFKSFDELRDSLFQLIKKRKYLAQKGIHLLKYKGRRFDLRVMAQKSPANKWETTGIAGRVAAPDKAVTNVHNGGTVKDLHELLGTYASSAARSQLTRRLRLLGVEVGQRMQMRYPGVKEVGLDIALDESLYPWILEVNTCPDPYIFRKIKDKSVFRRISRYAKAYGRL